MSTLPQVMTEILHGDALAFSQAAKLVPSTCGAGNACPATIWRWCRRGYKLPGGRVVKLEHARLAGRWLTSKSAIARFMEQTTQGMAVGDSAPGVSIPTAREETRRRKASEPAAAKLAAMGA